MGFHAPFGTTHGRGRLGHIQFLPVTQQERFPLTCRQFADFVLDLGQNLGAAHLGFSTFRASVFDVQRFQQVEIPIFVTRSGFEVANVGEQRVADLLAAEMERREIAF